MRKKDRKAVVDLILKGKSAQLSANELGMALSSVIKELRTMAQADDPVRYARLLAEKKKVRAEYLRRKLAIGELRSGWRKYFNEFRTLALGAVGR